MSDEQQLQVERTIAAEPERIFALLADPAQHTALDGSGMLRGLASGGPVSAVGDEFVMNMHQGAFGDYQMRNTIVSFEPNRRIGWAPNLHPPGSLRHVLGDLEPTGWTYEWRLEPVDGGTRVTHIYDWSGVEDPAAQKLFPVVSVEQLTGTLDRLEAAVRS